MKNTIKYVGLDVHQSTVSVAVLDAEGKLILQSILATHAAAILDFVHGVRGSLQVTFEEGTQSAWLYDLLVRHVAKVVVCNPRKNALLKAGNKSDQIDARKLAELLRAGLLSPVYHGENSYRILQELVRSYTTLTEDTTQIMARLKASIAAMPWYAAARSRTASAIARNGCSRCGNPAWRPAPSDFTTNSMPYKRCAGRPSTRCWPRVKSLAPIGCLLENK